MTNSRDDEEWKRLWWSLVATDRTLSAVLGRPLACHDEESVEPLHNLTLSNNTSIIRISFDIDLPGKSLHAISTAKH